MRTITLLALTLFIDAGAGFAQDTAREIYLDAREHLLAERYESALSQFRQVVSRFPASDEADDAQYYVGLVLSELNRDREAIDAFGELLERWPDSVRVERARMRRAELVTGLGGGDESDELLREVIDGDTSWRVKRETAFAMARKGNFGAADVLEEAMERESSSRQIELARILSPHVSKPAARRILLLGLGSGRSSSVRLRALQALEPVASREEVADAIGQLLMDSTSSSVKQQAVQVLRPHLSSARTRRAMARALDADNSSSVQMAACSALDGRLLASEVMPSVVRLFQRSTSSSVQLSCLASLERDKNDVAAAEIFREAIRGRESSSSVRLKAVQLAGSSDAPEVRAVVAESLASGISSSVQLQALHALRATENDETAARALDALFRESNVSSSVLLAGLDVLDQHMATPSGPSALGHALSGVRSSSVQLKALDLAGDYVHEAAVRRAVSAILEDDSTSTSAKIKALTTLRPSMDDPDVRGVVGAAIRPSSSTSVVLRAVEALESRAEDADSRRALATALDDAFSTSVVLAAVDALSPFVREDSEVRSAFVRTMERRGMSSTARIRTAEHLLSGADGALRARIADAMEDVIAGARRQGWSHHRELVRDALEVLERIDRDRAERLRARFR